MKKQLPLIAFACVVLMIAAYAFLVEFKGEERKIEQSRILPVESSAIQKITISKNGQQDIILHKESSPTEDSLEQERWTVVSPLTDLADEDTLSSLLMDLTEQKSDVSISSEDLKDFDEDEWMTKYGLDQPAGSFQVLLQDSTSLSVKVGSVEGLNKKTYLIKEGLEDILIGDPWWRDQLNKKVNDFRDKQVVLFDNLQKIIITQRDDTKKNLKEMQFIKTEDIWMLDGQLVETENVEDYLQEMRDLRVQEFVAQDAVSYDDWILNIVLQEEGDSTEQFHNLKLAPFKGDDAYIFVSPRKLTAKVLKSSVERLIDGIEDLEKLPEEESEEENTKEDIESKD